MKIYPALIRLSALAVIAAVVMAFTLLSPATPTSAGGKTVSFKGNTFTTFIADPTTQHIQLHWKDASGQRYSSISNLLKSQQKAGKKVLMITNAGMFQPSHAPNGLYIENGRTLVKLDTTTAKGNFYLKPNGVFAFGKAGASIAKTEAFNLNTAWDYATQSGPMLVFNDTIHPAFQESSTNKYIRSGVGIEGSGKIVFAISNQPVNFHTFASLFKDELHCPNALYLDGAISLMYLPGIKNDMGGEFGPMISVVEK